MPILLPVLAPEHGRAQDAGAHPQSYAIRQLITLSCALATLAARLPFLPLRPWLG